MIAIEMAMRLPAPDVLLGRCKAVAMLDALVSSSDSSRRATFLGQLVGRWQAGLDERRRGKRVLRRIHACWGPHRRLDHESSMSPAVKDDELWPGSIDSVPPAFEDLLPSPYSPTTVSSTPPTASGGKQVTPNGEWVGDIGFPASAGEDVDGSTQLAVLCDEGPDTYVRFAEKFYGRSVDSAAALRAWNLDDLTDGIVRGLRPDRNAASFTTEAGIVGYPTTTL